MAEEFEPLRRFPILTSDFDRRKHPDWPVSVPWRLVQPFEKRAVQNHQQSLGRLAERGGLSVLELLAVLTDRDLRAVANIDPDQAVTEIMAIGGIRRPGKTVLTGPFATMTDKSGTRIVGGRIEGAEDPKP